MNYGAIVGVLLLVGCGPVAGGGSATDAGTRPGADCTVPAVSGDAEAGPVGYDCDGQRYRGYCDDALLPSTWGFDSRCESPFKLGPYGAKQPHGDAGECGETITETALKVTCCP